jgi:hypothetical protein
MIHPENNNCLRSPLAEVPAIHSTLVYMFTYTEHPWIFFNGEYLRTLF